MDRTSSSLVAMSLSLGLALGGCAAATGSRRDAGSSRPRDAGRTPTSMDAGTTQPQQPDAFLGMRIDSGIAPGSCSPACGGTEECCNGVCFATATNPNHCGACGNRCSATQSCVEGTCTTIGGGGTDAGPRPDAFSGPPTCTVACAPGAGCCSGVCTDLSTPTNCGACGARCLSGQQCCNGQCTDVQNDDSNCGTCGTECSTFSISQSSDGCTGGRCTCNGGAACSLPNVCTPFLGCQNPVGGGGGG